MQLTSKNTKLSLSQQTHLFVAGSAKIHSTAIPAAMSRPIRQFDQRHIQMSRVQKTAMKNGTVNAANLPISSNPASCTNTARAKMHPGQAALAGTEATPRGMDMSMGLASHDENAIGVGQNLIRTTQMADANAHHGLNPGAAGSYVIRTNMAINDSPFKMHELAQKSQVQTRIGEMSQAFHMSKYNPAAKSTAVDLSSLSDDQNYHHLEVQKDYTIRHFFEGRQSERNANGKQATKMPFLGRMKLSDGFMPIRGFEKKLGWMKKTPLMYLPLFAMPGAAFAYPAPAGFDDFDPIHELSCAQQLIDLNKGFILSVQSALEGAGVHDVSAGISMVVWAACLKLFTTPFYENALKYPTQMEKAVQDVIEAELKRSNPDEYTYEQDHKEAPQQWTNPLKAQIAPLVHQFGVMLPLFYIEVNSLIQLLQERPAFGQPFLWIPCLDGPSLDFGFAWMQGHSLAENLPYLIVPLLVSLQMAFTSKFEEKFLIPQDQDDDEKLVPIDIKPVLPFILGGASLAAPAAISLNWVIAQQLAMVQFFLIREKLKKFDGLDIEEIRLKDEQLRLRMEDGQSINNPSLIFDFDHTSGDIKVQESPIALKNETQRKFLQHNDKN